MRIVYLNQSAALGGGEFSLLDLLTAIGEANPEVERHLVTGDEGPLNERARKLNVRVHLVPMPASLARLGDSAIDGLIPLLAFSVRGLSAVPGVLLYARRFRDLLRQISPDIIHSNSIKTHLLSAIASPPNVPVVWHVRDFLSSRTLMSRVLRLASGRAAGAIAVSRAVEKDVASTLHTTRIETLYDAIDTERFCPAASRVASLDERAGLTNAGPQVVRIGLVATYAKWKGQLLFLDAAKLLTAKRPDLPLRYFIAGGPIYRTAGSQFSVAELESAIAARDLAGRVGLAPFDPEPAEVYRALDIVVHASTKPEPFGRTIVEAMACGRPVIVSGEGGAIELFEEGVEAVSFRPRDADDLARTIERVATDTELRLRLTDRARAGVIARFSRSALARQVIGLYKELRADPR